MSNEIQIVVSATDRTAAGFDSATKRATKLAQSVSGQVSPALSEADKRAAGLGGTLRRIGEVAGGMLLADAVQSAARRMVALVHSTTEAASALGESVNAVNKTFDASAGRIKAWGEQNAASFGLSTRAFNQMATPLGAMLKNQGLAIDQVADHTLKLTQRAADMASVFNTDVTDALIAIQAGLRGEQDPLERYGVSLSAVAVEARALADTHKTSAAQLTAQEKALARLNIIYDQTADTAGDFRDTSDGLANSQRIMRAEIENSQAKIGQTFLPVMAKAAQVSANFAQSIGSMPQPILVVTAAIAGLGAALLVLAPRIVATRQALETMALSESRVERGAGKLAGALGKAGAALAVFEIASMVASSALRKDFTPQVEAATKGLAEYAEKGKLAGESARLFGEDAESLAEALRSVGDATMSDKIVNAWAWVPGVSDELANAEDQVKAFDQVLAEMVRNGNANLAGNTVALMAAKAHMSIEDVLKLLPTYSAAVEVGADKTNALGNAAASAAQNVDDLGKSLKDNIIKTFGLEEAEDRAADAVADLADQVKRQREEHDKGAGSLVGNTQAARDNREAVRDLVSDYQDLVVEYGKAGKSTDGLRKNLEDALVQIGFNRVEAKKYADQLGLIPDEVTTQVRFEAGEPLRKAQELHREMARLAATTVYVRNPDAGGHAHGGITGAESGGVRGGWAMVGERGRELVKLPYGSHVVPNGTTEAMLSGGGGNGGPAPVNLHLYVSGREVRHWLIDDATKRGVPANDIRLAYP